MIDGKRWGDGVEEINIFLTLVLHTDEQHQSKL
jgi:hypothetical protein